MGKRGNIVQSYPAIEYDWSPDNVDIRQGECLDFHIHGSDFNAAKDPNNGEGWKYSDRSNLMQKSVAAHNFPAFNEVFEQDESKSFFDRDERYDLAYLGQKEKLEEQGHECLSEDDDDVDDDDNDPRICGKLNSAPNHYKLLKKVDARVGTYDFISTRNNNFSNRDHALTIAVSEGVSREAELRAQQEAQSNAVAGGFGGAIVALIVLGLIGVAVYMLACKGRSDDDEEDRKPKAARVVANAGTTGYNPSNNRV